MSQTFHVLLCVVCKTFQVQIVKKSSNKWNCKVCHSKQSVQQVYAKGTGAECRNIVQRLNEARCKREENRDVKTFTSAVAQEEQEVWEGDYINQNREYQTEQAPSSSQFPSGSQQSQKSTILAVPPENSKWAVYLED